MSLRAAIRAKVEAANVAHLRRRRARAPSARWRGATSSSPRRSCAPPRRASSSIGGLSGTGKSALAAALAPEVGRAPGALTLRSDVERKRLFAVAETERLPPAGYDLAATEATYARLIDKARRALAAGQSVILDAVYAQGRRAPRRARCSPPSSRFPSSVFGSKRRWRRASSGSAGASGDASDADAGIAARQSAETLAEPGWSSLEAGGGLAATVTAARRRLKRSNSWLRPGDLV